MFINLHYNVCFCMAETHHLVLKNVVVQSIGCNDDFNTFETKI